MNVDDAQLEDDEKRLREMQGKVNKPKKKVKLTATTMMPKLEMAAAPLSPRGRDQKPRNPSSDVISQILLQTYKGNLKYSQQQNCFFIYEYKSKGLWSALSDIEMKGEVKHRLDVVKDHLLSLIHI